jgi:phosphoribosyl 1,2-cyclic phosphodiesterase
MLFFFLAKRIYFAAMSLFVTSLNSGSNGNCYYIGNEEEAILVDAGLSCRETEKRMKRLDLDIKKVKAIFISHEHGDHIKGVAVLSAKYGLPVYITPKTLLHSRLMLKPQYVVSFTRYEIVAVGNLQITAFPKHHDAADAHSFVIEYNQVRIGVFTDIGKVCDQLTFYFKQCHAAFLETNYDEEMLQNGRYPYHLKNRISGGNGHLSNHQAFGLFISERPPQLSHLFLSHLSADNNDPALARSLFQSQGGSTEIIVASRYKETAVYYIDASKGERSKAKTTSSQLSLFQ